MRVLLINPPARKLRWEPLVVPPLGIAYLASVAKKAGHYSIILDAFGEGLDWDSFAKRVTQEKWDVIGLTGMTPVFDSVKRSFAICRENARFLVLGGPHATAFKESILKENPELDFAVFGEGEQTFIELLDILGKNQNPDGLPGLVTQNGVGPSRTMANDLDKFPFPARGLLPMEKYRYPLSEGNRITTIVSSRGCPYQCIFCDKGTFGSKWRARSPENVLNEIDEVVQRFGVNSIVFYDDLFTVDKSRLQRICEGLLRRNYNLSWKAEGRVDLVDDDILSLMRQAGCDTIAYGVESANQNGLDYLGKNTTPEMVRGAFFQTRKANIKTMGYFILGIPVETYDDALRTIQLACEIDADYAQFSILSPTPGTKLFEEATKNGWYREIPAQNISDKDQLRPVVVSKNWDEHKLISIVREAHRRFYLRPRYILKNLGRVRSLRECIRLFALGVNVVKYAFEKRN